MRLVLLACLLLDGCAIAHVQHGHVDAWVLGNAKVEMCDPGTLGTPGGTFAGIISAAISGAVLYFTGGGIF
jgi:hypothetical protein